jgi:hypothetical protein
LLASLAIGTSLVALSCSTGSAQVLLTIDTSDVSNVVITATGSAAGQGSATTIANDGVTLLGFFTSSQTAAGSLLPNSTLQGGGLSVSYDDFAAVNYAGGAFSLDANLYVDSTDVDHGMTQTFTTSSPAFTGTWTIDLGSLGISAAALPGNGASGQLFSGDANDHGVQIGTYDVVQTVPEPTTIGLALVGFAITGVAVLRRKVAKA